MKPTVFSLCLILSVLFFGISTAAAKGNAAKGKAKYILCVACHGAQGEGKKALNAPTLAGQQGWYIRRQLLNFKAGIRGAHAKDTYGKQMRPMAMTLATKKDVNNVVAYIKTLKAKPTKTKTASKGNAAKGKVKYILCTTCHGAKGKGKKALNAPALAGQQSWYMIRQLKNFKAGIRGTHAKDTYGKQMRPMAMTLATNKDILNVVAYIKTLK